MNQGDDTGEDVPQLDAAAPVGLGADWTVRLISGLIMAAAAAGIIFAGQIPFYVLVVLVAMLLSWEWGRLVRGTDFDAIAGVHVAAAGASAILAALGWPALGVLMVIIGAILTSLLSVGGHSFYSGAGVVYAGLPSIALIWLRSDAELGLLAILFLVLIVVTTDVGAFVAGRLLGGPKLWPRVSPNKTWSGLLGGVGASLVVGGLFSLALPASSAVRLALVGAVLAVVAQAGDLAESSLKRQFNVKDTSTLIPGHGGVMDRLDGLVAAALAVGLAALIVNIHSPARALLLGP